MAEVILRIELGEEAGVVVFAGNTQSLVGGDVDAGVAGVVLAVRVASNSMTIVPL
ncbi:MAG: hypothetical protein ABIL25_00400 [candidate division WOR-3 bacterium]